ncbi:hypothetical protein ATY81_03000 [Rhizobium sp. R72]|uniref:hypothetical protein n=1 Tax=unclassified Rhizobium TaxID=2613769 RepID=UPI000B530E5D|nr:MULTISPECIES: hypothetical protein [unclassified Rhizobium]OWV96587.1 hypothetical protein ATY79_04295 [Rhizobium sp. R693]OWW04947.1 hypothetical protein ATY81_03000 [Rhizobium sp. R72]OWW06004.1 hypothetical protein ATY80_03000 [Rhizobium sp. R711]
MKLGWQPRKWLEKKAKRGVGGYPVGTIAFYGPDNRRATKAAASIIPAPQSDPSELRRWFVDFGDVRTNETILVEIATFLRGHEVRSVAMTEQILGCPHEEGIDYPSGGACPNCPYWAGRNRWTGQLESG